MNKSRENFWCLRELVIQYRNDLNHPVTDPGSLSRRIEAIDAALLNAGNIDTCNTCQKCAGFMKKGIGGNGKTGARNEWLSECLDKRMTLPHDALVFVPLDGCVYHEPESEA